MNEVALFYLVSFIFYWVGRLQPTLGARYAHDRMNFFVRPLSILIPWVLAAGCMSSPWVLDQREAANYRIEMRDVPRDSITAFDWEVHINAPPWRTWNVMLDLRESYRLTGSYTVEAPPQLSDRESLNFVLGYKPHWYFPSLTGAVSARVVARDYAIEAECLPGGSLTDCYFHTTVLSVDGGKRSILRMKGYLRRPWYLTFGTWAILLKADVSTLAAAFPYRLQRPEYATPDARLPWADLNAFTAEAVPVSVPVPEAAQTAEVAATKKRIALLRFETYSTSETMSVLAAVSGEYWASLVSRSAQYEVMTSDDVNVLMRYMGERWSVLCNVGDECQNRLANLAHADFLLSGGIRQEAGLYHVHLALLNAVTGGSVWRFQRTVPADSQALTKLLEESSIDLTRSSLP